ncbi:MAG: S-adenosylmethionine:tRNA ribosyltransferase-isomerase [Bacteroidia bacterium]|nr:S-adenosylmethionine:tRNA ribosyltransferase-isomerase [Bacteroidia bacterium]
MPTIPLQNILLSDYHYDLPEDRIAQYPLPLRDQAKLLIYRENNISHKTFFQITEELSDKTLLVFNDTKVIRARLFFHRESGARIEIFLLNPHAPHEVNHAMQATGECAWSCVIGRKKRWKEGEVLRQTLVSNGEEIVFQATLADREKNLVIFSWSPAHIPFADILRLLGELPLPPYIQRKSDDEDTDHYQTVYARQEGAVAAPTAGLHFTENVLNSLKNKGVKLEFVTLHVSAGTFLPVKHNQVVNHEMHTEQMVLHPETLERLMAHPNEIVAVGTTSLRVLESIYWLGIQILADRVFADTHKPFLIQKLEPYSSEKRILPTRKKAFEAVLQFMNRHHLRQWTGETQIMILPGYEFRVCSGLMTNFHLPGTTLMLLVAAFVGPDWRKIYQEALDNHYRFLSYGDTSLLFTRLAGEK